MRAIQLTQFGRENLTVVNADPEPLGPHDIRVAIEANSLNYRDAMMIEGQYNPKQPLPLIPLSDGAGTVSEIGNEVTRFAVGDRVMATFAIGWLDGAPSKVMLGTTLGGPLPGMLRTDAVMPESAWVSVPDHLSPEEAASLPCAAATAWSALTRHRPFAAGEKVLLLGTGGVSVFALQLVTALGGEATIISSSNEKLTRARALGAKHTLNYRDTPQWGRAVREMAGGDGFDRIVEVGGAGTLDESLQAIRPGGHIALIGVLAEAKKPPNLTRALMTDVSLQGVLVGPRSNLEALASFMAAHKMHPVVDRTFDWTNVGEALAYLAEGKHFGKICLSYPKG